MNVSSGTIKRTIAVTELLLISPALLFMIALVVRELQPQQYEPAHTAERIVMWYAARQWTLWVLLIALPLAALVIGSGRLLSSWRDDAELRQSARQALALIRAHLATLVVAAATLAAAGILVIVGVHMLTD
ncbi:MAG TPA: hypothetical protein VGV12_15380 [Gemmatimonadales bacterium]|nr:hypothetical protein [Gemmatimonadales bacterium]